MVKILSSIFLCFSITLLFGQKTFYVATSGNDNTGNGGLANPYATLSAAINAANPGDIIELRGGTYTCDEVRVSKNNLTIRSYKNEKATLQTIVSNEDITCVLWYNEPGTEGGLLENLEIIGGYYYGVKFESDWDWDFKKPFNQRKGVSKVTIRNCNIHHTGRDGIKLTPACNYITVEGTEIHHTGVGPGAQQDLNAEGIDNVNSHYMSVRNCYFHDIATNGLYVKGGGKGCVIENNTIENCGEGGIYLGFYTDADWFDTDANPEYYENVDGIVKNNRIINAKYAGIGIFGAKNPKVYNNTIINAASSDTYAALIIQPSEVWVSNTKTATPPSLNVSIYNNIFTQGSGAKQPMVRIRPKSMSGTTNWDNNVYYKDGGGEIFIYDDFSSNNLSFADWKKETKIDANSLVADPKVNSEQKLLAGSPCINAGHPLAEVTRDYEGHKRDVGVIDIGCDEFGSSTIDTSYTKPTLSVAAITSPSTLKVWKTNDKWNASFFTNEVTTLEILCVNIEGKVINKQTVHTQAGNNIVVLNTMPTGVYFVQIPGVEKSVKVVMD